MSRVEKPRFERRDDGVWVYSKAGKRGMFDPAACEGKQPLEWDQHTLKRCIDRFQDLDRMRQAEVASNRELLEVRKKMGRWIDNKPMTPQLLADLEEWANHSLYDHSLKMIAEEYWARVCNAIILGDE